MKTFCLDTGISCLFSLWMTMVETSSRARRVGCFCLVAVGSLRLAEHLHWKLWCTFEGAIDLGLILVFLIFFIAVFSRLSLVWMAPAQLQTSFLRIFRLSGLFSYSLVVSFSHQFSLHKRLGILWSRAPEEVSLHTVRWEPSLFFWESSLILSPTFIILELFLDPCAWVESSVRSLAWTGHVRGPVRFATWVSFYSPLVMWNASTWMALLFPEVILLDWQYGRHIPEAKKEALASFCW